MNLSKADWYLSRLRTMSPAEVGWRTSDFSKKLAWSVLQVHASADGWRAEGLRPRQRANRRMPFGSLQFVAALPPDSLERVPREASRHVVSTAEEILDGRFEVLGVTRDDMTQPDWFLDPLSGRHAPRDAYCFRTDHRSESVTGNVKQVWEFSRMHHLTVLASAFALTGDERYAKRSAEHLRSWWSQNPFLSGIHWTSGIEVGIRLITWVWVRRLLEGWAGVRELFEDNEIALTQVSWHQRYLAGFRSRGSSANNHVVAEAAGQLVASLAFDWFDESERWARDAAATLETELEHNTFPSGVDRELAFEYHGFVTELGLLGAVEADRAGRPLSDRTWALLARMLDVVASTLDVCMHGPRQGDSDDGRALLVQPSANKWAELLCVGSSVFGAPGWWPRAEPDATSVLVASLASHRPREAAPSRRPSHFDDAGLVIMRSSKSEGPEIWCRGDAGPHGFLSIAAHAHADALAIEVRHDGTEILCDPGTYCYQGDARWRSYFRSTVGHNTIEIDHRDQSDSGGSTLWTRHARTRLSSLSTAEDGEVTRWTAEHDGYAAIGATHERTVDLSSSERRITILDRVRAPGSHTLRIGFHLGPRVDAEIRDDTVVVLTWAGRNDEVESALLTLPEGPSWSLVRGSTEPVMGWYSPAFGQKEATTTVLGQEVFGGSTELNTILQFAR